MNKGSFTFMVKCENCNEKFAIEASNLKSSVLVRCLEDKKLFRLTMYTCPYCANVHYAQIDNSKTSSILHDINHLLLKSIKNKKEKKSVDKKQSEVIRKLNTNLEEARNELIKNYTGKSFIDYNTGEKFESVKFSI